MTTYHLIELKYQGATNYKSSRFKLSSLRFPGDSLTVSLSYKYDSILPEALEILKGLKFRVSGYGYDEKKGVYIICSTTFEPLKEKKHAVKMLAEQMSEKQKGWHKDHYNYNKAEKWERPPAKRKTPARNVKRR